MCVGFVFCSLFGFFVVVCFVFFCDIYLFILGLHKIYFSLGYTSIRLRFSPVYISIFKPSIIFLDGVKFHSTMSLSLKYLSLLVFYNIRYFVCVVVVLDQNVSMKFSLI